MNTKGFGLITGSPGKGKTTAVRHYTSKLNDSLYKIIYSSLSTITASEFYKSLALNLGAVPSDRAIVLLVGLPKLNNILNLSIHEALKQRIIMNYNITGLTKEESKNYIQEKINQAGCKQDIFNEQAIEAIANSADGTMRIINKICNQCLIIGNALKKDTIDNEVVLKAINDLVLS